MEKEKLKELQRLQFELDAIRQELGIGAPNEILYLAGFVSGNEQLVVEADGFGAAVTSIIEGNYPIDFWIRYQKRFDSEGEAVDAAERIVENESLAAEVLTP
jgi:hypothetical protein